MDSKPQVINNNLTSEYPNFLVGRKVSVITSLNGITTARVPSVIVKDEAQEFETSDGGSISSSSSGSSGYSDKDAAQMGMRDTHSRCSPVQEEKFRPDVPFHEEDLRPQPIQRKSRKVLVLDEDKDEKYWEKRRKNNAAAKRSREARRSRENQIAMRASYLEKDNQILKEELLSVKEELQAMREQLILAQQGRLPKRCELPE